MTLEKVNLTCSDCGGYSRTTRYLLPHHVRYGYHIVYLLQGIHAGYLTDTFSHDL